MKYSNLDGVGFKHFKGQIGTPMQSYRVKDSKKTKRGFSRYRKLKKLQAIEWTYERHIELLKILRPQRTKRLLAKGRCL